MFDKLARRLRARIDAAYIRSDQERIKTTRNLRLVPARAHRTGGKVSYGEWCHVAGIFQTLVGLQLGSREKVRILDVGCGTGLLAIATEPFVQDGGEYVGMDVRRTTIDFCRQHYAERHFRFLHLDTSNPTYTTGPRKQQLAWDVPDESMDMVTALSVWTHLNEKDACFYFKEVERVLKPSGKAIITFFVLDALYEEQRDAILARGGRFHQRAARTWIFDQVCSSSGNWLHPEWVQNPEDAIGVATEGLQMLIDSTSLRQRAHFPGNWKELPGIFFQDILVFEKNGAPE